MNIDKALNETLARLSPRSAGHMSPHPPRYTYALGVSMPKYPAVAQAAITLRGMLARFPERGTLNNRLVGKMQKALISLPLMGSQMHVHLLLQTVFFERRRLSHEWIDNRSYQDQPCQF